MQALVNLGRKWSYFLEDSSPLPFLGGENGI